MFIVIMLDNNAINKPFLKETYCPATITLIALKCPPQYTYQFVFIIRQYTNIVMKLQASISFYLAQCGGVQGDCLASLFWVGGCCFDDF